MKFHYQDKVTITSGFYKGSKGIIRQTMNSLFTREYMVRFKDRSLCWVVEKHLKKGG